MLYLTGYPMTLDDIEHFRQVGWPTAGHPERKDSPGIEATTGPLGQGISMSVGIALAERMLAARFNRDGHEIVDHLHVRDRLRRRHAGGRRVRGIVARRSSRARTADRVLRRQQDPARRADLAVVHRGRRPSATTPTAGMSRTSATICRWSDSKQAARDAMAVQDRPSLVIVRSHIGYGSPHKQDTSAAHGSPLGEDEVRLDQGGVRLGSRQALLRARRGARPLPQVLRARPRARVRVAAAVRRLPRRLPGPRRRCWR